MYIFVNRVFCLFDRSVRCKLCKDEKDGDTKVRSMKTTGYIKHIVCLLNVCLFVYEEEVEVERGVYS